jgi:hypothetical protein
MDDSYLDWLGTYTSLIDPLSKGEQHRPPVFSMSMPIPAPFTTLGPIPSARMFPHDDPLISLALTPTAHVPRVPMPHVLPVTLTRSTLLQAQIAPVRPIARPVMPTRHTSAPFILRKAQPQPSEHSGLNPPFPFPHPVPCPDPILPPHNDISHTIAREKFIVPSEPDAGCLFGSGTPGPPVLRSIRSENNLRGKGLLDEEPVTKGPYTSEKTPKGPPPAPLFIGRDIVSIIFFGVIIRHRRMPEPWFRSERQNIQFCSGGGSSCRRIWAWCTAETFPRRS